MKLNSLLSYDNITIQCHDNPDADTIASGWGLYTYFKKNGKNPSLIYSGKLEIAKGNLVLLVDELDIPIEYRKDNTAPIDGLLITVDCQYGAKNVTKFQADDVVIIDHHQQEIEYRLDIQAIKHLWTSISKIHGEEGAAVQALFRDELVIQNIVWALRLKLNFGMTKEEVIPHLMYVTEKPCAQDPLCAPAIAVLDKDPENYEV